MPKKEVALKHSVVLFSYLLIVWGFYRFLFQLPQEIEEIAVKPLIWLIPTFILLKKEQLGLSSLGITFENLFPSVYFAICLGAVFAIEGILVNFVKYGQLIFNAELGERAFVYTLGLSLLTAISEEIVFRGFIMNRLMHVFESEFTANLLSTIGFVAINLPVTIFVWQMTPQSAAIYLSLVSLYSFGAGFLFARTKNLFSPILLHIFWEWPIILFR